MPCKPGRPAYPHPVLTMIALFCSLAAATNRPCFADPQTAVICPAESGFRGQLAGREIRRYVYLRTGELLPVMRSGELPAEGDLILVAEKGQPVVARVVEGAALKTALAALRPQQYVLKTIPQDGRHVLLVVGGDGLGTLYGAYRLAEHLGARFFMHGDVIPDRHVAWKLPEVDETGKPLFELRGVNPWGSHPFGFDLWSADQYKAHFAQLAKMRMNFLGIHCYPEGLPYAEPTVWLGLTGDFDEQGRVKSSYPSRYFNTAWTGTWGPMLPHKTSEYVYGGSLLFEDDDWGPDVMAGYCPSPTTPEECNDVFNRTGELLREAFTFAHLLGVKTCLGTEAPIMMPEALKERLKAQGKDPADPAVVEEVYQAMFRRIAKTHPLDYYWLWTPEGWTWSGNTVDQLAATMDDVKIALAALKKVGEPFKLATSGWVLGPNDDRAAFDRLLPKEIAVSAISRTVGHTPVDEAFGRIEGREKWAIPWLEDDMALASPQLWVGRTRKDSADALAYGCTGLMGLHWRTRILGPNVLALARAGWDQSPWNPTPGEVAPSVLPDQPGIEGPLGGPAYQDYTADGPQITPTTMGPPRGLPVEDFYADWTLAMFGPEVAQETAALFSRIDGRLPRAGAGACPCGLAPDPRPWEQVAQEYAFVDELARCRTKVQGPGNLSRFDYWLDTLQYLRAQGRLQCAWGDVNAALQQLEQEQDSTRRRQLAADVALPKYRELLDAFAEAYGHLLATTSTYGAMATVISWEHNPRYRLNALEETGQQLAEALGNPLPDDARPAKQYEGPLRLVVPTVRTMVTCGEPLNLKVIVLSAAPPDDVRLHWRPLGPGPFTGVAAQHVARGVYRFTLPPDQIKTDVEYYVEASAAGSTARFPATAPSLNQTVVVAGPER